MFHCIFEINRDQIETILGLLVENDHTIHSTVGNAVFTTCPHVSATNSQIHNDDCLLQVECWIDT